ncbi:MAG: winged helix-turn-helix transcriptional regulator [Frankia sp.]
MSRSDYCPIAAGAEVLGDRWTPLVIRELTVGASGFNEIHRGIPRVSRTLLAQHGCAILSDADSWNMK